uniref:Uncharacterized protein n=1 Tax=Mycetohabitans sp. TaxID=2571162 RepID=A0A6B9HD52_9BURK|nr:hypothetical protein [Mycetohabitans sp.]
MRHAKAHGAIVIALMLMSAAMQRDSRRYALTYGVKIGISAGAWLE